MLKWLRAKKNVWKKKNDINKTANAESAFAVLLISFFKYHSLDFSSAFSTIRPGEQTRGYTGCVLDY